MFWIFYVFVLSCVCYVFVRVCLYVLCGHLLGKGWPLGSRLWCLLGVCHFPIGILGQVWYLIVSIPDLCTLNYLGDDASITLSCKSNIYVSWSTSELRVRLTPWNRFKPSSKIFLLTFPRRLFFCGSFVLFMSCVSHAFAYIHCCIVPVICWVRADLLALVCDVKLCFFFTFPYGILGQVSYLIVSIPDLCHLSYYERNIIFYIFLRSSLILGFLTHFL